MSESFLLEKFNVIQKKNLEKDFFAIEGLPGLVSALWLAERLQKNPEPILLVTESLIEMETFAREMRCLSEEGSIAVFPHRNTAPYDQSSTDKKLTAERITNLQNVISGNCKILITTVAAMAEKLAPPSHIAGLSLFLKKGEKYIREELINSLLRFGYNRVDMVEETGEFSVRGELMDVFPNMMDMPVRLIFFDEELEQIRTFEIATQRSQTEIEKLSIYSSYEFSPPLESIPAAGKKLRAMKAGTSPTLYDKLEQDILSGFPFTGEERYLPFFFERLHLLPQYFSKPPCIIYYEKENCDEMFKYFCSDIREECEISLEQEQVTLSPEELFLDETSLKQVLATYPQGSLTSAFKSVEVESRILSDNQLLASSLTDFYSQSLSRTGNILSGLCSWNRQGKLVFLVCSSLSRAEKVQNDLLPFEMDAPIITFQSNRELRNFILAPPSKALQIIVANLPRGFRLLEENNPPLYSLVIEDEIYGQKSKIKRKKRSTFKQFQQSVENLVLGDFVVHIEYGIGIYQGLQPIAIAESHSDFILLEYYGGDKIYVPIDQAHLIQKYDTLDASKPKLHKIGENKWQKTKSRVSKAIYDMAEDLIAIYSARKAKKGIAFSPDGSMTEEFANQFPFQETADQDTAIDAVRQDQESESCMERLICGDVGFGKTEIAMRGICKVVADGYQAAILAPTTILARQHYETLRTRFRDFPIMITIMSRFQSPKEIKEAQAGLENGTIDIVVGTHRLLSKDIRLKNLGLLIVDEEQRFGVRHKEQIKMMSSLVDTLTLTATPIPRTLHLSLMGVMDISVINTPPLDRRSIRTRVLRFSDHVIKEAVERETRRNGQVYIIYNRVEGIYQIGEYLKHILPKVSIEIAHGQMAKNELESIMLRFIVGDFTILLATTIIESGIDIPNANTIIIYNAQNFGLSQLYQLRGRVGRGNRQAYAYLLTPEEIRLSSIATKRLQVLKELTELGSGFKIASYDLELRGAGNILGTEQSGQINGVGIDLYISMIDEAVQKIKEGQSFEYKENVLQSNINLQAFLPEEFIENAGQRLAAYKDISGAKNKEELWNLQASLEDRFGSLPAQAKSLFQTMRLKLYAINMGVSRLDLNERKMSVEFAPQFEADPLKTIEYLQKSGGKFEGPTRISWEKNFSASEEALHLLQNFKKSVQL